MAWRVPRWETVAGLDHAFLARQDAPPAGVTTLRQVHGRVVIDVADLGDRSGEGDGLVTARAGARVGVWTADCVPVHLVAPSARVAAAVHSGWRGSAAGVVDEAIARLASRWNVAPDAVEAALGPAVGGCCYEVGEEVRQAFTSRYGRVGERGFTRRDGRLYLDLRSFLAERLAALGVSRVARIGPCTACRTDVLHSFRREGETGRQLSYVGWV
ncbi:MAG: peptidoglycan editing factor PgeF [Candidatus Binatia bacterium]